MDALKGLNLKIGSSVVRRHSVGGALAERRSAPWLYDAVLWTAHVSASEALRAEMIVD